MSNIYNFHLTIALTNTIMLSFAKLHYNKGEIHLIDVMKSTIVNQIKP